MPLLKEPKTTLCIYGTVEMLEIVEMLRDAPLGIPH